MSGRALTALFAALATALACATADVEAPDVAGLAAVHGVAEADLSLFLVGYEAGYRDGISRDAGIHAGTGASNVSGVEGRGWSLGHQDARNGRVQKSSEELAAALARSRR
jgi:hypothetical protein